MTNSIALFGRSIRTELMKVKRTSAFWLTVGGGLLIPVIYFLVLISVPESFNEIGLNPWILFFTTSWGAIAYFLLPFYIVLLVGLIVNIEHKANTWKVIYTAPLPKWTVYFGKLTVILIFDILCHVIFICTLFGVAYLANVFQSELKFFDYEPSVWFQVKITIRSFVATLAMISLQYWLSTRMKKIIAPIGIGLGAIIITAVILTYWRDNLIYYPYAYSALSVSDVGALTGSGWLIEHEYISLIYFVLISGLSFFAVSRSSVK